MPPPAIKSGALPADVAAAYIIALDKANGRIVDFATWYASRRAEFEQGGVR